VRQFSVQSVLEWFWGCVLACKLQAGGSGLNTVVVINQTSSNSCELGNYYCNSAGAPQNVYPSIAGRQHPLDQQ